MLKECLRKKTVALTQGRAGGRELERGSLYSIIDYE